MRSLFSSILILLFVSVPAVAQTLTCPSSAGVSEADCSVVHYHVLAWKPSSKRAFELYGLNQFSSTEVCEQSRAREEAENKAVVAAIRRANPKSPIQENKYGPCHCDMTESESNAYFLDQTKRDMQIRLYEQIRRELRWELLDAGLSTDSKEVQSLSSQPSTFRSNLWPKFLPPPPPVDVKFLNPEKVALQDTEASKTQMRKATISAEIQLVPIQLAATDGTGAEVPETPPAVAVIPESTPGEAFVTRETERVQSILGQSNDLADDSVKGQVFEALMQRLQALSNLRSLVATAGARSRLAARLESVDSDDASLALVGMLFGDEVRSHWQPETPDGAVVSPAPDVANDPVAVLRDTSGRFDETQRKTALYLLLARNASLTSNEQLWLSQIVEAYLQ